MSLHEYGITEEQSDIRAHVSDRVVYVFQTHKMLEILKQNKYPSREAFQPGHNEATARGYLVPHKEVAEVRVLKYTSWPWWSYYSEKWDTSRKGRWAVVCVTDLLKIGRFPLWIEAEQTKDIQLDINGTDILAAAKVHIQVKCDYPAVKTGNLYIQTHEQNPLNRY